MDVFKFGFKYWRRNVPLQILFQILSFIGIIADLMLPMLSGMFINYVILSKDKAEDTDNIFIFLLDGRFGEIHTMKLCISLGIIFMCFLLLRIIIVYIKNVGNQKIGRAHV